MCTASGKAESPVISIGFVPLPRCLSHFCTLFLATAKVSSNEYQERFMALHFSRSVSYTHLDVYKRQVGTSAPPVTALFADSAAMRPSGSPLPKFAPFLELRLADA